MCIRDSICTSLLCAAYPSGAFAGVWLNPVSYTHLDVYKRQFTLPFSQMVRAAEAPVEEKAVWSSCTVNCGSRCLLRLHVKDDTRCVEETGVVQTFGLPIEHG